MEYFSVCSKFFLAMTTTSTAAFFVQTLLGSANRLKSFSQCNVFLLAYTNLHGWLLYEEGAHLAASKRLIIVSSSNSSPVIDLGDHLFRISGFILYCDCLVVVVSFCSCSIDLSIDIVIR